VHGEVEIVDDVPTAFADLVVREQPRTIALSGGGTAQHAYEVLATRSGLDWSQIEVLFGDERMVPVDDERSNEGMARRELLDHVAPKAVHSMATSTPEAYEALLRRLGPVDLVHLGMGPDGHTASLFPGTAALDVTDRLVVRNEPKLEPFVERMTFTFPALATARHVVVTVEGEGKLDAWRKVRAGADLPAGRVTAQRVTWLVGRELAS
jgi:6-phosphogluconolactonase